MLHIHNFGVKEVICVLITSNTDHYFVNFGEIWFLLNIIFFAKLQNLSLTKYAFSIIIPTKISANCEVIILSFDMGSTWTESAEHTVCRVLQNTFALGLNLCSCKNTMILKYGILFLFYFALVSVSETVKIQNKIYGSLCQSNSVFFE